MNLCIIIYFSCPFGFENDPECKDVSLEMIGLISGSGGAVILLIMVIGCICYRRSSKNIGKHSYFASKNFLFYIHKVIFINSVFTLKYNALWGIVFLLHSGKTISLILLF